jgi:hypothetical protein
MANPTNEWWVDAVVMPETLLDDGSCRAGDVASPDDPLMASQAAHYMQATA